jgi:membrane fusion protein (multidrug efflux system)
MSLFLSRLNRFTLGVAMLLICSLLVAWYFWQKKPMINPNAAMAVTVETIIAKVKPITTQEETIGSVISNQSVDIKSELSGRITDIHFQDGQSIEKGALLISLDDSVQQAELAIAKANLQLVENNLKRSVELTKQGFAAHSVLEENRANVNLAKANVQLATANLAKTRITSPFSGRLGIRQINIGDVLSVGQLLVGLDQLSPVRIQFSVSEKYIALLKTGSPITFYGDQKEAKIVGKAVIHSLESRINPNTRTITLESLYPNDDLLLFPGQFVRIQLPLMSKSSSIILPDRSIVSQGNQSFVFKIVDKKAQKINVETGIRLRSEIEIISGVVEGDEIVVAGQQKLRPDAVVITKESAPILQQQMQEEKEPERIATTPSDTTKK